VREPASVAAVDAQGAFAACIAAVLELSTDEVPAPEPGVDLPEGWRRWLGERGVGLVAVERAATFSWAGPWIARVRPATGPARAVVMYGVPSGVAWDPCGVTSREGWTIEDGFVLAALDVALALPPQPAPATATGRVEGVFVAPSAAAVPRALDAALALPGRGLDGDRYVAGAGSFPSGVAGSALTLIAAEVIESFDPPLTPHEHRRNVVTRGVDLDALVGRRFTIGAVECRGTRLCEPCATLDRYADRPLLRPLVHRGGLRADVLGEGEIRVGDTVRPAP
jgi:hypothetical protein